MSTEVLSSFTALQNELNQAKTSLKDYDDNIKRLIGRDPSESVSRNSKRPAPSQNDEFRSRYDNSNRFQQDNSFSRQQRNQFASNRNQQNFDSDMEPPSKKRLVDSSVFKRLDKPRQSADDDYPNKPQMHSRVIVTPREVPSRQDALKAQDRDEKSKARNRRMFGALLGTLQKFRQEETKLKTKEEKRAQVEKKLEEQEVQEKAKIKKERYELFLGRKKKQQEIRIIEQKMLRIKEHAFWEEQHKPLVHFIRTSAKPHIFYLPRRMTTKTKEKLAESRKNIEKLIDEKKTQLAQELESIENRFKKDPDQHKDFEDGETEEHDEEMDMEHEESMEQQPSENIEESQQQETETTIAPITIKSEKSTDESQNISSESVVENKTIEKVETDKLEEDLNVSDNIKNDEPDIIKMQDQKIDEIIPPPTISENDEREQNI